jgi:hypothetical protein
VSRDVSGADVRGSSAGDKGAETGALPAIGIDAIVFNGGDKSAEVFVLSTDKGADGVGDKSCVGAVGDMVDWAGCSTTVL